MSDYDTPIAERIYPLVEEIESRLPHLTAGGYDALAKSEARALNDIAAEERLLRDDVYDRDDEACARTHLETMRAMADALMGLPAGIPRRY